MINKKFIQNIKKEYSQWESERRQIISLSNIALHNSKRVIFALHRDEVKKAKEGLVDIEVILLKLKKKFGLERINREGSYKAGVEEYVEAKLFFQVVSGKKIKRIKNIVLSFDSYLGGICDLTGELTRQAVNKAAIGDFKKVKELKKIISDIMAELVEFDMVGYLRTKYDQARNNLRKIEQINYEINLRR